MRHSLRSGRGLISRGFVALLLGFFLLAPLRAGSWRGPGALAVAGLAPALESLGLAVPATGMPSTNIWAAGNLLYIEAVDATQEANHGPFVAYDLTARKVVYAGNADIHTGFRSIAVDRDGNAYFSVNETGLAKYDPRANAVTVLPVKISESLRAATRQAADGWIYGATNTPDDRLFRFHPQSERVEDLGPAWSYTASMVLDPAERFVYWVPGAHGSSYQMGTPLLRLDVQSRETTVVAFLNGFYEARYGFRLGGTYALDMDPDGRTIFINMNAVDLQRDPSARSGFGDPAILAVHLPQLPSSPAPAPAGIRFRDVSEDSGIAAALGKAYLHSSSWGDADGDGRPDLFAGTFVQAGAQVPSTLLLNRGGHFVDAADPALAMKARASGSLFADFDADGDLDLFVVADALRGSGPSVLLRNLGGLRFADATAAAGLPADIQGLSWPSAI